MPSARATLLTAAAAGAAALLLTGCTTTPAGLAGVSVAEDGTPLGVLLMCHDHVDGAMLYPEDAPKESREITGDWRHDGPVTGYTSWPLMQTAGAPEAERWTPETRTARLEKGRSYRLAGWTEDGSWSATPVSFTPEDLARLKPGQVRYTLDDEIRVSSLDDFRDRACDEAAGGAQEH
ncbi:hypothetical protein HHL19_09815 [Streptomyces sp. R302]|uniref:hypothetical protein n=1 Tax=unclassified Streptomyces TaxID=2593676 RepID=UPI00145DC9D5|nr:MULTISPECIES: hypothetical protein [unclassified Streptomyces]NML49966.1 hypothetical protein [Streptomyces sp. R301]NML78957.1 hypothetical protein [Streptomyces sp. R302]